MKKQVSATPGRPEGNRLLDAELSMIDIKDYVSRLKEEDVWEKNDRNGITIFKTNNISVVLIAMHENARMKSHLSEGVMSLQVIAGEIQFTTVKETFKIKEEQIIILNKGMLYSLDVKVEAILLLTYTNL